MSRVRSLLLWLVVLVLPLQGLAATSMLFCGLGEHHARAAEAVAAVHDEAGDHHGADHGHEQASSDTAASHGKLDELSHQCGLCASCCFQVAVASGPVVPDLSSVPQADLAEPLVLIRALPSRVPEKPPRA